MKEKTIKKAKLLWGAIRTKKSERTAIQHAIIDDLKWWVLVFPSTIIFFPVMLLRRLYKWTYGDPDY